MRTIAYSLGALLMGTLGLLAQSGLPDPSDDSWKTLSTCEFTQCLLGGPSVLNAPFSADVASVWHPGPRTKLREMRATARYARDSAGRVRAELGFDGQGLRSSLVILTPGADSRTAYLLDPGSRKFSDVGRGLAQMIVGGGAHNAFVIARSTRSFQSFFQLPVNAEPIGAAGEELEQSIAGIRVTRTRFSIWMPAKNGIGEAERWVSPELKLVMYSRGDYQQLGTFEYRVTAINRSEPAPELFEVPRNYVETPVPFPLTWEDPPPSNTSHTP